MNITVIAEEIGIIIFTNNNSPIRKLEKILNVFLPNR